MQFYYIISVIMFSRLFFLFKDEPLNHPKILKLFIIQIIPLFIFEISVELILLFIALINLHYFFLYIEMNKKKLNGFRFLSLIILAITAAIFSSSFFKVEFNYGLINFIKNINVVFPFLTSIKDYSLILIIVSAVLFLLNEVNFFIRYIFEIFNLLPNLKKENEEPAIDEREYKAGRVIGMLERILIFFFVVISQFGAIGFIIAAKGFTRFKELDKREFAEYVLIGTLLSSLLAIFVGLLMKTKIIL